MLFALNRPQGVSLEHWTFQNKVLQSTTKGDKILFSSKEPFDASEASSWWLGYDVISMIDHELSSTSDLLERLDLDRFQISGVVGAESPRLLAKHIETTGWLPVNARVQVSDPTHLARTLGGRNLYGDSSFAPVRELVSNAVDSVRARRIEDGRDRLWGTVRVTLCQDPNSDDWFWLHIDDTGIGMSEPVLTGALLDFGISFWSSSGLQEEYPGLLSRGFRPIGKFGIGFFSSFLLGDHVRVCSRSYKRGESDARVLEFTSLEDHPILRPSDEGECPKDFTTRVSVRISRENKERLEKEEHGSQFRSRLPYRVHEFVGLHAFLRRLIATLDVSVEFVNETNGEAFVHASNWQEQPIATILSDLEPDLDADKRRAVIDDLFEFVEERDEIVGVAALPLSRSMVNLGTYISVDGFTYPAHGLRPSRHYSSDTPYVGILFGDTDDAARQSAVPTVSPEALRRWSDIQAKKISRLDFAPIDGMKAARDVLRFGGNSGDLPFAFHQSRFLNYADTRALVKDLGQIVMPIQLSFSSEILSVSDLRAAYFTNPLERNLLVVAAENVELSFLDHRESEDLRESEGEFPLDDDTLDGLFQNRDLNAFRTLLVDAWSEGFSGTLKIARVFEATTLSTRGAVWVLSLQRARRA